MITLPSPITVPTSFQTVSQLQYILVDDEQKKTVVVRFKGIPNSLTLWAGADYDAAGDYTQAQVDARITSLLGSNPAAVLSSLFTNKPPLAPASPVKNPAPAATPAPSTPAASPAPSA